MPPKDPIAAFLQNALRSRQVRNGLSKDAQARVARLFDEIVEEFRSADLAGLDSFAKQSRRLKSLMADLRVTSKNAFLAIHQEVETGLTAIAKDQARWAAEQLEREILAVAAGLGWEANRAVMSEAFVTAILRSKPIEGSLLRDSFLKLSARTTRLIEKQIRLGLLAEEPSDKIIRRIRGRAVSRGTYAGGVFNTTTREAEALVRTSANFISNEAHFQTYEENEDVVERYEYVATLDARTTLICASLDGEEFRVKDANAPRPPQHFRCRSTTRAVIAWKKLGLKPPPASTRASVAGQVSGKLDYEAWLRGPGKAYQDEVLGPHRAILFRQGKVSLSDLVRSDGSVIPISELAA